MPGGFFGAAPEPAPGAEHLGQPGHGFGSGGGFNLPGNGSNNGGGNPFAGESFVGGGTVPEVADWGFGGVGQAGQRPQDAPQAISPPGNGFLSSMPPAGDPGSFGFPGSGEAVQSRVFGFDREPDAPAGLPAAGVWPEAGGGRTIDLRLRDLFSRQPVQMTGIDPMGIPQDSMVRIPVSLVESQLASGSFSLKLSELAALAEPVAAAVLMRGNPEARIALPENEVFRQAGHGRPDAGSFPATASGPEAQPSRTGGNPFAGGFETLFSQGAKSDAAFPPGFGAPGGQGETAAFSANPFLQSSGDQNFSPPPASFSADPSLGHNPFAGQDARASSGSQQPVREDFSAFLPPRAQGIPHTKAMAEPPADPVSHAAESHFPRASGSFLEELEKPPTEPAPVSVVSEPVRRPVQAERSPMPEPAPVRDIELRAVFGTSEAFTLQRVADLTTELSGVESCFVFSPLGSAQAPQKDARSRQEQADSILRGVRELARITGVENAETFTMHTGHGMVSVFMHGDACLTIRHQRGDFEPGVREKLILVVRGVSRLGD